jgi:hypothetical protein
VTDYTAHNRTAPSQHQARERLYELFRERPLPDDELLINVGLYTRSSALAKLLFLDELYRRILPLPGVIMVFGTWWGQDVVVLHNLRAVHEPYNALRRVVGFDTFTGYPEPSSADRTSDTIKEGAYHVGEGYLGHLESLLDYHRAENVMGHEPTFELVAGDVTQTLGAYFDTHPEVMVSLAYLDLALYEPSKAVLELLKPRMVKGGIIAMDELNSVEYPGETLAYREVFGLQQHVIERSTILPDRTMTIIG